MENKEKAKLATIPNKKLEANPKVIKHLEEAIEFAKVNGAVEAINILVFPDGSVLTGWATGHSPFTALGAMTSLQRDYLLANVESDWEDD